jgi:hypothetical protein
MPEYHDAKHEQFLGLNKQAADVADQGTKSGETGDQYVRITVLLATVLLITAIGQRFHFKAVRVVFMILACLLLCLPLFCNYSCCLASKCHWHRSAIHQKDFGSCQPETTARGIPSDTSTTKVQLFGKTRAVKNACSTALVRTDPRANGWRACLRVAVDSKSKTKQPGTNQES